MNETEDMQKIILKTNSDPQRNIIVHADVAKYLKTHQIDGIKFLFDNCYQQDSGCILAHCMGLGNTLQVIAMLHTVINSGEYSTNKVLVLCPISTIINWKEENARWLNPISGRRKLEIFELDQKDDIHRKISYLQKWSRCNSRSPAACLIMGYESFRNLVNFHLSKANAKKYSESALRQIRESIANYLLKPAEIVICDEGHVIKNLTAGITLAVNQIQTKRRVILTGTPMQNHLMEYYSMVNFVRPNFLGSQQHFNEYFAEPIKSGQHADSCDTDIKYMKQQSYALNKKLSKIVQRREISLLKDFLPEKFEFVLFVPLTAIQYKLYKFFLDNRGGSIEYKRLFGDYTCLRKIWTHLKVLDNAHQKSVAKKRRATISIDDANVSDDDEFVSAGGLEMVDNDWWRKVVHKNQLESALSSYKMVLIFEILWECQRMGDKCVIFSSFVESLNVVESFMQQIVQQQKSGSRKAGLESFVGPWKKDEDYYRLDGSTPVARRHSMITKFNDVNNTRTKVFLISAQAGGQGINLRGANRLILIDTSWNPSKDQQSIFRIYRMGQTKHCYVYRLLSMGTMEEKIYSRSVTKQAMSCRVVDKQQIDRHYSMEELYELYRLTETKMSERPTPMLPKDSLLAHLLRKYPNMVYKYLEHDSLLANKVEEELNDVEKKEAWQRCQEQNAQPLHSMTAEQQAATSSSLTSQDVTIRAPTVKARHELETMKLKDQLEATMNDKADASSDNKEKPPSATSQNSSKISRVPYGVKEQQFAGGENQKMNAVPSPVHCELPYGSCGTNEGNQQECAESEVITPPDTQEMDAAPSPVNCELPNDSFASNEGNQQECFDAEAIFLADNQECAVPQAITLLDTREIDAMQSPVHCELSDGLFVSFEVNQQESSESEAITLLDSREMDATSSPVHYQLSNASYGSSEMKLRESFEPAGITLPDSREMDTAPSPQRKSCHRIGESSAKTLVSSNDDNRGISLQLENVGEEQNDSIECGAARSLSALAKVICRRIAALQQEHQNVPDTIDDYTYLEQIITSNECNNLEYRIAFKRPSDSNIQRPIKKLMLSLEFDPSSTQLTADQTLPTLSLSISDVVARLESSYAEPSWAGSSEAACELSTLAPLNDVIAEHSTAVEEMCPESACRPPNIEQSSSSMDLDSATGDDSSAVEDEETWPNNGEQSKEFIVMTGPSRFAEQQEMQAEESITDRPVQVEGISSDIRHDANESGDSGRNLSTGTQSESEQESLDNMLDGEFSSEDEDDSDVQRQHATGFGQADVASNGESVPSSTLSKLKGACSLM